MDFPILQVCSNYAYYLLELCLYVYDTRILDVSQNILVSPCSVQWISLSADFCVFSENTKILANSGFI
jgi:hypothetical protein